MTLTFLGAAGEVTGSCHLVEAGGRRFLLDCGMFQGPVGASWTAPKRCGCRPTHQAVELAS